MNQQHLLSMLVVGLLVCGCGRNPDRIQIQPTAVSRIVVDNRGGYSTYESRLITDRDTIDRICDLLNRAKHVSLDTVNVKLSLRFARFNVYNLENEALNEFSYSITPEEGNILWYRGSWFRSDSLDLYLKCSENFW